MISCNSEFRACTHQADLKLNLSEKCVSIKLRVTGNHACFILVILNCNSSSTIPCFNFFLNSLSLPDSESNFTYYIHTELNDKIMR